MSMGRWNVGLEVAMYEGWWRCMNGGWRRLVEIDDAPLRLMIHGQWYVACIEKAISHNAKSILEALVSH